MPPTRGLRETSVTLWFSSYLFLYWERKSCYIILSSLPTFWWLKSPVGLNNLLFCWTSHLSVLRRTYLMHSLPHSREASVYHLIVPVEQQKHQARAGSQSGQRKFKREFKFWSWSPVSKGEHTVLSLQHPETQKKKCLRQVCCLAPHGRSQIACLISWMKLNFV